MTDKTSQIKRLTERKKAFAQEWVIDRNASQAAARAGYSKKTAYSQGQRLLKDVAVKAEIERILRETAENKGVTLDRVIDEFARIAFADFDITQLKPADKLRALEGLMRHLGGFANDSLTVTASDSLKDLLQAATNKGHILPKDAEERERLHS